MSLVRAFVLFLSQITEMEAVLHSRNGETKELKVGTETGGETPGAQ